MKVVNVLHIASFNGNVGDNANHNGFRRKFLEGLGHNIKYTEIEMREFYKSWNLRNFNSESFIKLCNEHDLIVIGGGNFFGLKWDYSHTGTTVNITTDTLDKIETPIFFHGLGCDIAKGASENAISKFERFLDRIVKSDKYLISVRNDGSYNTINKLYGNKYNRKIYKVPDGGFFLETESPRFPWLNNKPKIVGVNIVSDMKDIRFSKQNRDGIGYGEFIDGFSEIIDIFLNINKDYQIIFFPHIYSDLMAVYEVLERINDKLCRTRIIVAPCLTGEGSEKYIFGLYKKCEFILGMRFHSNVCSIAQGIPSIGLSSYKKIHDLYLELNLLDRVVYVNQKGFQEKLKEKIQNTMNTLDDIKNKYKEVNNILELENNEFYKNVRLWVDKNNII